MESILFTGIGSIGKRHLRLLRDRKESFDIHAYRSGESNVETPAEVTEHYDLDAALEVHPDIAFITNPTSLHIETAIECARADCDLFIEKPISDSLDGIDELINIVAERGLITYVGCQLRFSPVLQSVQNILEKGKIGNVLSYRAYSGSYLPEWRPAQDYRNSYSASRELGGGVVLDLVHEFDYAYWLFGDIVNIESQTNHVSSLEIETEDICEAVIETEKGAVGNIHVDYIRRTPRRSLEVIGESGTISADLIGQTVTIQQKEDTEERSFDYERDDKYRAQLDHFLSHVRDRDTCANDLREGKRVLEIALAARGEF